MQWADIKLMAFSFPTRKNTIMNNTITISDMHGNRARTNIDVGNDINHIQYINFYHHDN
jgi:hypothetical protein